MMIKEIKRKRTIEVEEVVVELEKHDFLELMAEVSSDLINNVFDDDGKGIPIEDIDNALIVTKLCADLTMRATHKLFGNSENDKNDNKGE